MQCSLAKASHGIAFGRLVLSFSWIFSQVCTYLLLVKESEDGQLVLVKVFNLFYHKRLSIDHAHFPLTVYLYKSGKKGKLYADIFGNIMRKKVTIMRKRHQIMQKCL